MFVLLCTAFCFYCCKNNWAKLLQKEIESSLKEKYFKKKRGYQKPMSIK